MSEFYKMEPLRWDRGTDDLTLEQEAAYLRVCNAIYAADQPIRENYRLLAGMWRCNERKAKRLLAELISAGKLRVDGGWIVNERAVDDVSKRRELRVKRQLAGHAGGIESGKSRAKPLDEKEKAEAIGSTRKEVEEEVEAEKKEVGARKRASRLPQDWNLSADDRAYALSKGLTDAKAEREAEKFRNHWHAKSGRDATKMDWAATWRNWVLRDAPAPSGPASAPADVSGLKARTWDKLEAGFRSGRFYPVSMMDLETTEEMIRRGCLTREAAARHHYPLAADPIRRTA